jgi:hypothetical protein
MKSLDFFRTDWQTGPVLMGWPNGLVRLCWQTERNVVRNGDVERSFVYPLLSREAAEKLARTLNERNTSDDQAEGTRK